LAKRKNQAIGQQTFQDVTSFDNFAPNFNWIGKKPPHKKIFRLEST